MRSETYHLQTQDELVTNTRPKRQAKPFEFNTTKQSSSVAPNADDADGLTPQ